MTCNLSDSAPGDTWEQLDYSSDSSSNSFTDSKMGLKVLRRKSNKDKYAPDPNSSDSTPRPKTGAERQREYEEARARIFGGKHVNNSAIEKLNRESSQKNSVKKKKKVLSTGEQNESAGKHNTVEATAQRFRTNQSKRAELRPKFGTPVDSEYCRNSIRTRVSGQPSVFPHRVAPIITQPVYEPPPTNVSLYQQPIHNQPDMRYGHRSANDFPQPSQGYFLGEASRSYPPTHNVHSYNQPAHSAQQVSAIPPSKVSNKQAYEEEFLTLG
eukprot:91238_1